MNKKGMHHEMSWGVTIYCISFLGYTKHIIASKIPRSPTENKAVDCSLLISPRISVLLSLHWALLQGSIMLVFFYWQIRQQILFTESEIFLWWFNPLWGLESKTLVYVFHYLFQTVKIGEWTGKYTWKIWKIWNMVNFLTVQTLCLKQEHVRHCKFFFFF